MFKFTRHISSCTFKTKLYTHTHTEQQNRRRVRAVSCLLLCYCYCPIAGAVLLLWWGGWLALARKHTHTQAGRVERIYKFKPPQPRTNSLCGTKSQHICVVHTCTLYTQCC